MYMVSRVAFVADASTVLPFAPAAIYRNDEVTTSAALSPYDVYYYNESARTVWIYNKRAAGRVTAVSPSASAPTSVTVAGVTYTIASPSVAYQLSSLSGGGVGQVVTLLLGMNDAAVSVLTGDAADAVFYGVVQSSSRTLVETNSAEVQQAVSVMCTDGTARTVNVDNKLNFPAGKLVEIINAAKEAHSWEFIKRLPKGLDTVLSEDSISQGQKQLLCITRVMLCLPPMLILDEATSSIDTRTELQVQEAFDKLMQGRTSFVVAHRLSTIRNASLILVMKDGKIIEQGRHEELLEKKGFYYNLYNSQFQAS